VQKLRVSMPLLPSRTRSTRSRERGRRVWAIGESRKAAQHSAWLQDFSGVAWARLTRYIN
jgi:hypothetical protein